MRILIAEDEQSNLEEIKRILAQADFPVDADSFLHPNEALNAAMTAPTMRHFSTSRCPA